MFAQRKLLIATKHEKEKVIAPILEKELGVQCFVVPSLDTDLLGTFTGEIERQNDPLTTARRKCLLGIELANCDLAVSSEGSFGPHPSIFFASADDEILCLVDQKNQLEIVVRHLSTDTNFRGQQIKTEEQLWAFAQKCQFPSHGLIIRKTSDDHTGLVKGITDESVLLNTFRHFISEYQSAYVETDMRALFNPTRMKVIEEAAFKLVDKIKSCCPSCQTPGFGVTEVKSGLPCAQCRFPTRSTLSHIYTCTKCGFSSEKKFPHDKHHEDPTYCDMCNP